VEAFLVIVGLVFIVCLVANRGQEKSDEKYEKYLEELEAEHGKWD